MVAISGPVNETQIKFFRSLMQGPADLKGRLVTLFLEAELNLTG